MGLRGVARLLGIDLAVCFFEFLVPQVVRYLNLPIVVCYARCLLFLLLRSRYKIGTGARKSNKKKRRLFFNCSAEKKKLNAVYARAIQLCGAGFYAYSGLLLNASSGSAPELLACRFVVVSTA